MNRHSFRFFFRLFLVVSLMVIGGCGSSGSQTDDVPQVIVQLEMFDGETGAYTDTVSEGRPVLVKITVTVDGKPWVNGYLTTETDKGSFLNALDGTQVTDANGTATYTLAVDRSESGAGRIGVNLGDGNDYGYWYFTIGSPLAFQVEMLDGKTGNPTTVVSDGTPGLLRVTVTRGGKPVTNYFVTVTTDKGSFQNSDGTNVTDVNGMVTYTLVVNRDESGAGRIRVLLEDGGDSGTVFNFTIGPPVAVKLGTFLESGEFIEGKLSSSVEKGEILSVGGTATFTATLAYFEDDVYTLYDKKVDITFSTDCETAVVDEVVSTVNGSASTTYRADGCFGTQDRVTATATIFNEVLTASEDIDLARPATGSIEFVSATPTSIALLGVANANHPSTSVVVFLVKDQLGNPVRGEKVDFALTTVVGGLTLSPVSADTNNSGLVQTVVTAGRVPTAVRVKATVSGTMITNLSDSLNVNTGLPDQNSFSLSAFTLNPEAWSYNGETVEMTIRAADDYNNPVPDGTAIAFITEGGYIEGSCLTKDGTGACSVTWTSSNPRPDGSESYYGGDSRAGRVTILATALGQESFQDRNGSGLFESDGTNADVLLTDMPEAFLDANENGIRNTNEWFLDYDTDGLFDMADGKYNGLLCNSSTGCTNELIHVRDDIVIVMSTSFANITFDPIAIHFWYQAQTTGLTITVSDENGNSMPYGTTIAIKLPDGTKTGSDLSYTIGNALEPKTIYLTLSPGEDYELDATDSLIVTVTTPKNNVTTASLPVTLPPYIGDTAPEAEFEFVDLSTDDVPYRIFFTDKSTVSGGAELTGWQWDFGDGSTSGKQNVEKYYSEGGNYLVTLTVTNDLGEKSSITKVVEVQEPTPVDPTSASGLF